MNDSSLSDDELFTAAIVSLARSRQLFEECVKRGLVLGNDNHIGDIGEYWVKKWCKSQGQRAELASVKTSAYDILLPDSGNRVSVKTITEWSRHGKGTQIKPLLEKGNPWNILAVVILSPALVPSELSIISLEALLGMPEFIENKKKRHDKGTRTYPRVSRDWKWLSSSQVDISKIRG
jgi:hypothetical protein